MIVRSCTPSSKKICSCGVTCIVAHVADTAVASRRLPPSQSVRGLTARPISSAKIAGGDPIYRLSAVLRGQRPRLRGEEVRGRAAAEFPYALVRVGVLMTADPDDPREAEGVLNPASGWGADGELYLLPRVVAKGNVSRVGLIRVRITDGVPAAVERLGMVLEPEQTWETAHGNAGVEDPRVTWIEAIGLHVMTYVALGPLGPRTAIATSTDLRHWKRRGPVLYRWDDGSDVDLNLFHNKDTVFFPEPVTAPDGTPSLAVLHRPMGLLRPFIGDDWATATPPRAPERHQSIWISFLPLTDVRRDPRALTLWSGHRFLAGPEFPWEELKIGGGPPPVRVSEGWLVLHHGVTGVIDPTTVQQQQTHYVVG